jgi:hypothetical protein
LAAGGATFELNEGAVHQLLDDDEHGVATDSSAIYGIGLAGQTQKGKETKAHANLVIECEEAGPLWCPASGHRRSPSSSGVFFSHVCLG